MNDLDAILARESRRKYLSVPLSETQIHLLDGIIEKYNRTEGIHLKLVVEQPRLFGSFFRSYGLLSGVDNFIVMAAPAADPHGGEKVGFFGELLVLEATKMNLGTCWVGGSFDKKAVGALIPDSDHLFGVVALGNVEEKTSPRENLIHFATHRKKWKPESLFQTDGTEPDWFGKAIDLVAKAPSALNRHPAFFTVKTGRIACGLRENDATASVDLGIAKAHFRFACPEGIWDWGETGEFHYPK